MQMYLGQVGGREGAVLGRAGQGQWKKKQRIAIAANI
jgi:hypothetical protein